MDSALVPTPDDDVGSDVAEQDLTAHLAGSDDPGGWTIETPDQADWAVRKMAEYDARAAELNATAQRWIDAANAAAAAADFFRHRLEFWGERRRFAGEKTMTLAHGTVRTRTIGDTFALTDDAAALAWAKEHHPDIVKSREWVTATGLKDVGVHVTRVIVAYDVIHRTTGEVRRVECVTPLIDNEQTVAVLAATLRDEGSALGETDTELAVRDADGNPVPGADPVPGRVSVTVKPIARELS